MSVGKRKGNNQTAAWVGLAIGSAVSLILTIILTGILAALVLSGTIQENVTKFATVVITMLSAGLGAMVSALIVKRMWMIVCCGTGVIYLILLATITVLAFHGQFEGAGITILTSLLACGAMGLFGLRKEVSKLKIKKRYFR